MALVGYSDSEDSDIEDVKDAPAITSNTKRLDRTESKKIKIDLPALRAENDNPEPAAKRQRTAGAFSGFNSLLPPPKKTAQTSIKPGVSLRTSSEAAFSRAPPPQQVESQDAQEAMNGAEALSAEPKLVGKATRFLPLSVANAKKKKPKSSVIAKNEAPVKQQDQVDSQKVVDVSPAQSHPARQSLFSMQGIDEASLQQSGTYEPEFMTGVVQSQAAAPEQDMHAQAPIPPDSISQGALQSVATDLNLSAADRRRLFGRNGNSAEVKVANFNMDHEYRANQDLAANGEVAEHRAVKAIAPGKHSLQQLVNNVRGQTDALEDKWAEGRRNREQAGSRYGWG